MAGQAVTAREVLGDWAEPIPARQPGWRVAPGAGVQAVVNRAVRDALARQDPAPIVIALDPGRYAGPVILPDLRIAGRAVPVSLQGAGAGCTHLEASLHIRMTGNAYRKAHAARFADSPEPVRAVFERLAGSDVIGPHFSGVLTLCGDGAEISGLSIRNLYGCDRRGGEPLEEGAVRSLEGRWSDETHQAYALYLGGARARLEGLVLSSFQDTLYLAGGGAEGALVRGCRIEGDVDFVFGPATGFFDRCEIRSLGVRSPNSWAVAPSTPLGQRFGLVFDACDFSHDGSPLAQAARCRLGRQWFSGVRATPYGVPDVPGYSCRLGAVSAYDPPRGTISRETLLAVGKCRVQRSRIGAHIDPRAPWDDWKGGQYHADGRWLGVRWGPRFRPVQTGLKDLLRHLEGWPDLRLLELPDPEETDPFLSLQDCTFARQSAFAAACHS